MSVVEILPKRLSEALVGAAVRCTPANTLWAPSARELEGRLSARRPLDLILQCSWGEQRRRGPSTRISRAVVETYYLVASRTEALSSVRFVLLGEEEDHLSLFSIGVEDLQATVVANQRGTINADSLSELRNRPSRTSPWEPCAVPLADTLCDLRSSSTHSKWSSPVVRSFDAPLDPYGPGSRHFFNRPTPLAIDVRNSPTQ